MVRVALALCSQLFRGRQHCAAPAGDSYPLAQVVHVASPAAENLPAGHTEHEVALVVLEGTRPAGHTKHASTLPGEYFPLGHPLQELRAGVTAKVPAPHDEHVEAPALLKLPTAEQKMHADWPVVLWYCPALHALQLPCPARSWNCPAVQLVQEVDLVVGANVPTGHVVHDC